MKIEKPTPSIQRGLKEFTKEQCLKALELHEKGDGAYSVAYQILPTAKLKKMTNSQITYSGDRLINTGRYLKYSFTNLDKSN